MSTEKVQRGQAARPATAQPDQPRGHEHHAEQGHREPGLERVDPGRKLVERRQRGRPDHPERGDEKSVGGRREPREAAVLGDLGEDRALAERVDDGSRPGEHHEQEGELLEQQGPHA